MKDHHTFEEGLNADQREVEQRDGRSLLLVGRRDVGEEGVGRRTRGIAP
jgi:hypothetical protein